MRNPRTPVRYKVFKPLHAVKMAEHPGSSLRDPTGTLVQIPAEVIAVIPTADRSKATVKVRIGFKQKDPRIVPEMGARVAFLDDAHQSRENSRVSAPGVVVPPDAVVANGDSGVVFVINGNTAEQRTVRLGTRNADGQTILAGLPAGALVAVGDLSKLSDRAKVHIVQ